MNKRACTIQGIDFSGLLTSRTFKFIVSRTLVMRIQRASSRLGRFADSCHCFPQDMN
jgi:hypothetical protein